MTNTSPQPLEITHERIAPAILRTIRQIDEAASSCETRYFLAGAMAREVLLRHVFGQGPGRRTLDVDFGIAVRDWNHFHKLQSQLIEQAGFRPDPKQAQRLIHKLSEVRVDLIPFGGVQRPDGTILWPPEEDTLMRVSGFSEALESAVQVRLDQDLVIRVVSLPLLLILKLFAWMDRKYERRDAEDIYILLKQYGEAGNEDRLYGDELGLLEAENFDFELAGARLLGRDAARLVEPETKRRIEELLRSPEQMGELTNQVIISSQRTDAAHVRHCELLVGRMRQGFLEQ